MFSSHVIADTIHPLGKRITTLEVTYPRFIHAEIMTHRDRSRNAGSSRAIPWAAMQKRIEEEPVVPIYWGAEQKGMQTGSEIAFPGDADIVWLKARDYAMQQAEKLAHLGVHKSLCNRLTEPFMWITVVMTSTSWRNFFKQRCHKDAEIHMQEIASLMRQSILKSEPAESVFHLPYIQGDDTYEFPAIEVMNTIYDGCQVDESQFQISTARCARVSYVQHGEKRKSVEKDLDLFNRLLSQGHWSPFEHPSIGIGDCKSGCYDGWKPYRKFFAYECPQEGYES